MALNKTKLTNDIHAALKKIQDTPPPKTQDQTAIKVHFAKLLLEVSADLANAIDAYIRAAAVTGVESQGSVTVAGETATVITEQTNTGQLI